MATLLTRHIACMMVMGEPHKVLENSRWVNAELDAKVTAITPVTYPIK